MTWLKSRLVCGALFVAFAGALAARMQVATMTPVK
jgi:hypothetical protein